MMLNRLRCGMGVALFLTAALIGVILGCFLELVRLLRGVY